MPTSHHFDVVVVGGGLIGLTCAYELTVRGLSVAVVESSAELGGLARTVELSNGKTCEAFYHHFFTQDAELAKYVNLFLQDSLTYQKTTMSIFESGKYYAWNGLADLLSCPIIGMRDKLRFIISTILLAARWLPPKFLAEKSLSSGMKILYGDRAYMKIWGPMIDGKFGAEASNTALEWMSGRLSQRLSSRSRGAEYLGFLPGSLKRLIQAIALKTTKDNNSKNYLGSLVTSVREVGMSGQRRFEVLTRKAASPHESDSIYTDNIIFTINSSKANLILKSIESVEFSWRRDNYFRAICVLVELRRSISNFYWNNLADANCFFTGYIEQTQLTGLEEYGGLVIGYLTKYLAPSDPGYSLSVSEFEKLALSDLNTIAPLFDTRNLINLTVSIAEDAQVVTPIGYQPNSASIPEVPWIKLVNISMTYPEERGINNAIKLGKYAASLINEND